jgi:hypothetical protein
MVTVRQVDYVLMCSVRLNMSEDAVLQGDLERTHLYE